MRGLMAFVTKITAYNVTITCMSGSVKASSPPFPSDQPGSLNFHFHKRACTIILIYLLIYTFNQTTINGITQPWSLNDFIQSTHMLCVPLTITLDCI